ncbi:MAG: hypothetical protein Kow0059_16480 [Candidatus Sumerlaeia bacterium]
MRRLNSQRRAGLVFVEILVVLVIVVVFSSFVILTYSTYRENLEITSAAQTIRKVLSTARTKAINLNKYYIVTIDIDRSKVWIDESNEARAVVRPKVETPVVLPDYIRIREVRINSTTYTSGAVEILFKPDGQGEYAVINLLRQGDNPAIDSNYYSIRLFPSTGTAQIIPNRKL